MSALLILQLLRNYLIFWELSIEEGQPTRERLPSQVSRLIAWVSEDKHQSIVLGVVIMDLEEDRPPDLVDISGLNKSAPSPITTQMQDLGLSKVPLTIVTGRV